MGLHHVVQILLTHRHMRRAIEILPNDPALRVRSESFPMSDSLVDGVSGRLLTDKQHSPRHEPGLDVAGPTVRHDLDHSAGSGPHAHSVPS
jgi:hypothetical protein